jgi:polyisoprenoid-binding protein YceI
MVVGAGLAVVVAGILLVYFVVFPTSSPKPFALTRATKATPPSAPGAAAHPSGSLAGTWKVAEGSQAGYRVREKLVFLPAESDAVGRTSSISGSATLAQAGAAVTITAVSIEVAVNTLKSDRSLRDEKLHSVGLESDTYPTATFVLTKPLRLPRSAPSGQPLHVSITGVVTIHGASRQETIPLQMSLSSSAIEAVGSLTFPWGAFNMTAPSIAGFVNVTEHATMEFDLRLQRA